MAQRSVAERFWEKVDRSGGPDACWPWIGATYRSGYGMFRVGGRGTSPVPAHRVAWELTHGPIPEGEGQHGTCICHHCDNRPCCNPFRCLFLGTVADNLADMRSKRRDSPPPHMPGELNGAAILVGATVEEIRFRYAFGGVSQRALSGEFGISQSQVSRIVRGESWRLSSP